MSKLVDKERLAKLAKGLNDKMKAAVAAEEARAKAAEQAAQSKANANESAITAINNAETGILAQAKNHANGLDAQVRIDYAKAVKDEEDRAKGIEQGLQNAIDAINGDNGALAQALADAKAYTDQEVDKAMDAAAEAKQDAADEADRAGKAEAALQAAIDAINNEANGILAQAKAYADTEDGKVEALVTEEANRAKGVEEGLDGRIAANEAALGVINGEAAGSIKKAEADAKAYADEKIAALVDSAPEAMNTLNELAKAINDNKDVYDGYVEQHAQAMAAMKAELQGEIDADVKVVADNLANEKDETKEGSLAKKIADEKSRAEGVEEGLNGRIAALETFKNTTQPAKDQAQDDKIAALEAKFAGDNSVDAKIQKVADDLAGHITAANTKNGEQDLAIQAAQDAADQAQEEVDALEVVVSGVNGRLQTAEGEIDALQAFEQGHSHATMEQGIADNKAAIEAEVGKDGVQGNRDKAIAAALEDYSTTQEMKTVIGNVVNSLALTMENDQVVLKLGGVDGVALTSVSLDMATDADIDTIINGLDNEVQA